MSDKIIRIIGKILITLGILKKMTVVRMDGGICSQMYFFLIGQQIANKGFCIKYDLNWFKKCGKDLTGKFERNFDLLKAFPSLSIDEPSKIERFFYTRLSDSTTKDYLQTCPPIYLGGYYGNDKEMYSQLFSECFIFNPSILDDSNKVLYDKIKETNNTVAIHIRRGDLSTFNAAYGAPVELDYFVKALNYLNIITPSLECFLFSDEPEWVRNNLMNSLPPCNQYTLIDINGSDKGYMDMFLISACKHQITSKGSLGKFGGFLNIDKDGKIIVFDDEIERKNWEDVHNKIVFIK